MVVPMNDDKNFLDRHSKYVRYLLVLSFITFVFLIAATSAQGVNCLCVDRVSSGTTAVDTDSSMTISHTTGSGSNRLMLVGISYNNDYSETVTDVTYNSVSLTKVGEMNNSDDAMVYIYSLVAPDSGTHNVVINFSAALTQGAVAGVMTFTGVDQSTPLGTFASNTGDDSTEATVNISSAVGELVFGVASAEYDAFTTANSGQTLRWNITLSGDDTNGTGGTDGGASTVTMTWGLNAEATPYNHWVVGGVSIKPASAGSRNLVMVTVDGTTTTDADDVIKAALFQSWGWTVSSIADSDDLATYQNAADNNDVMYIAESVQSTAVGTKARDLTIGVVVDENRLWDDMDFASGGTYYETSGTDINVLDNSHYITSPFSTGSLGVYNSPGTYIGSLDGVANFASAITILATRVTDQPSLFVADTGTQLIGLTAPARRVGFYTATGDASLFTSNTETLLERSLDWAAGCADAGGGGGNTLPSVNAGTDQNVEYATLPVSANLDGYADDGGDGPGALTTTWSKVSGPGTVTFDDASAQDTTAEFSAAGTYELKLTADDGQDTAEDTLIVTVTDVSASGMPAPDLNDYSCSMKITIDHTKVSGASDFSDFPVLISLTDDTLKDTGCGFVTSSSGDDIIFINGNKTLQLYHEIEEYDGSTGELISWVRIPTLSTSIDTVIYLYYGNSSVSGPQENPTDVWDSNYVAVWHLEDQNNIQDSTSYNNDGSSTNVDDAAGKIGTAQDFDGNDSIQVTESSSLDITGDEITLSAWVKQTASQNDDASVINKSYSNHYNYLLNVQGSDQANFRVKTSSGTTYLTGSTTLAVDQWYFIYGIYNGSTAKVYVNNFEDGTDNRSGNIESSSPAPVNLGRRRTYPTADDRFFDGVIDEARISNKARSVDWMKTEYNNQSAPSSFYSVDSPECPQPQINEFACNIPITIDSSKVSGSSDLIDFPVLIDITNSSLKTTSNCGFVENSNGWDIVFSDSTQTIQLDHEIEEYNGSSGRLIAWVRIPTLSATSDTTFYVHFGHSGVCGSMENPTGVWDSNYKGVWHLNENVSNESTGGTHYDSTSNDNDGTQYENDEEPGQIADGQEFEGVDDYLSIPNSSSLNTDYLTIEFWLKMATWINNGGILAKGDDTYRQYWIWTWDGAVAFEIDEGGHQNYAWNPPSGQWEHLALTYDGTNVITYRNGAQENSYSQTTGTIDSTTQPLLFGEIPGYDHFDGFLDEVRISNSVRSLDWIKTSYNNQSDPSSFYSLGASSCWLGGFSCNRKITVDSSKVAGSLTRYPMLVKIENDCNLKTTATGGAVENTSGWDIIFIDSDGTTQLNHEIEKYDGADGDLIAWVQIPTLSGSTDKDIYMYYGNSNITCDPSNPTGVWDARFRAVYHLHDDFNDSTQFNRDGTNYGATFTPGVIGNGALFDPSDGWDRVELGIWDMSSDDFTVQAWAWPDHFNQDDPRIVSKGSTTASSTQDHVWQFGLENGDNGENRMRLRVKTGTVDTSGTVEIEGSSPNGYLPTAQTWYHLAGTYEEDNSAGTEMRLYRNGLDAGQLGHDGNLRENSWPIWIGANPHGASNTAKSWDGILDEVRILSSDLSQEWLQTEYNNHSDPDSFYSMSQDTCGGAYGFNFQYCKKITVDHTQVNSDLTDFPLLVNIVGDGDLKTVANGGRVENSLGWDIVFRTDGCGILDHEIEKYNGSTGDLVAWVRVPILSSSTDTEIYMYYGDSGVICSPENPTGVWDSDYAAVWHLAEDPGGTVPQMRDSTANDNHATAQGGMTAANNQIAGKIGNGIDLDGVDDHFTATHSSSLDITGNQVTLEAWVRVGGTHPQDAAFIQKAPSTNVERYMLGIDGGTNPPRINHRVTTDATTCGNDYRYDTGGINVGEWNHVAMVYDGTLGTDPRFFVYHNGGLVSSSNAGGNICTTTADVLLGMREDGRQYEGDFDELRISSTARSADWIDAQYKNHNNPNFYTISSCFEQTTVMTEGWEEDF